MKTLLLASVVLVALSVICESKKHDDDRKHLSKHHHARYRLRGSHLKLKEGGVKSLHDGRIKSPKGDECVKLQCGHKEICIAFPKTGIEKCVSKKRFRDSRKLFHSFHKDKLNLKKSLHPDLLDKELSNIDHLKDVHDLLDQYNKNLKHSEKKVDVKKVMDKGQSKLFSDLTNDCKPKDMYDLKRRLVGWSVLQHTESRIKHHRRKWKKIGHLKKSGSSKHFGKKPSYDLLKKDSKKHDLNKRSVEDTVLTESHHHCKCSKSIMWEFHKQDKNGDGELNHEELSAIESNRMEPCMHPLFKSCDSDASGIITHGEWCCCMADTIPPCFEKKRQSDKKFYVPHCDREGYYKREQCLVDKSYCWCVDINGNEIMDTKRAGRAKCGKYDPNGRLLKD